MSREKILKIIQLLEEVADGRKKAKTALNEWPEEEKGEHKLLQKAWHKLSHFNADEDIRAHDLKYEDYQKQLLFESIGSLRKMLDDKNGT